MQATGVVRFLVSSLEPQVSVKWPKTWHGYGHGQRIDLGTGVVRFLVSCREPEHHPPDLPASKCEMAKVNCCRALRPAVALVALARPAGKLEPLNLVWSWPENWSRYWRCPFSRILSWAGAPPTFNA